MPALPLPPLDLQNRVGRVEHTADPGAAYLHHGAREARLLEAALPEEFAWAGARVLDFGCGAGRTLRHLMHRAHETEFLGCDVDAPSIAWLREHASPPLTVWVNRPEPPLALPDASLDLVYALSVFTHLDESWARWLAELHRVLRPGGLLVTTVLGERHAQAFTGRPAADDEIGMTVLRAWQDWDEGGPVVLHGRWWLRTRWGRAWDVHSLASGEAREGQDWLLLRRRPGVCSPQELRRPAPGEPREIAGRRHQLQESRRELRELRGERDRIAAVVADRELRLATSSNR